MEGSPLLGVIRGVLVGSNIYLALWLIGDLRLLRETPGVLLGQSELAVEMGLRANGRVGLDIVTGAQPIGPDIKPAEGLRAIRITPQPSPNCRIRLRSPVLIRGILGIPLRGEMIDIYVDDPTGLVSSIESAMQRS